MSVLPEEFVLPSKDDELKKDKSGSQEVSEKKAKHEAKPKPEAEVVEAETPKPESADEAAEKAGVEKPESEKAEEEPKQAEADEAAEPTVKVVDPVVGRKSPMAALSAMKVDRANVKSTAIKVVSVAVALLAVVVVIFGVLIYGYKSESSVVKAVAQIIPYPVERVNGHFVSYSDYLFEVDANKRAYQNNAKLNNQPAVDFNSADGKKLVTQIKQHSLDKLESDSVTAQLAAEKKVKVTDKEVNDLINQLYQRYGGKDTLLKTLNQIYGWNLKDLRGVVYKQLLAQDLQTKVTSDPAVDAAAKAKAQDVLKKVKAGTDFAALAKQNSQASDAASGGDLGFFTKGQLPDELFTAAQALQPGQVSDAIKDQYGYEILKVTEKKDDGSIHASHILIKTIDFNEYFQDQIKKAKVNKYVKV